MTATQLKPGRYCLRTGWPIAAWYCTCPMCGQRVDDITHPLFAQPALLPREGAASFGCDGQPHDGHGEQCRIA